MRLNQITIPVRDVAKAIVFYQTLGLELIVRSPHYARFVCLDGHATFSLHRVPRLPRGEGITIYFECEDLDEKVNGLIQKGIKFFELPQDKPWLWREAHFKDLDQNHLVLYYAGENRLNPPWKVSTAD